jgi:hypothetical protein
MLERRTLTRWQINKRAVFKLAKATEDLYCQIKDINPGGAQVVLYTKLPQDVSFKMQLRLSEDYTIEAKVWVSWHKLINGTNHYGLYFSGIEEVDKDKINQFISVLYPNDYPEKMRCSGNIDDQKEKGGESMSDYRIFERFRKEFSARYIDLDGKEGVAQTIDVSAKGLGLSTDHKLESQVPLEIWLDVPGSTDPVYTRGQVIWSKMEGDKGWHSGIELERADLMGISRLLRAKFNR